MTTYEYETHPYWMSEYGQGIDDMLSEIPTFFERAKKCIKNEDNKLFVEGFYDYYIYRYITECNIGENTGTQTYGSTENAITKNGSARNEIKTKNMFEAIRYLFQNDQLIVEQFQHKFDPDLAKKLNTFIGDGLFDCGNYRTKYLGPADSTEVYLAPNLIEKRMEDLFKDVRNKKINSENWYVIAADFFERFLYIHPFNNGNGRTARLLLSALLKDITIVPISLYIHVRKQVEARNIYLDCLLAYRHYKEKGLLRSLIIQSTHATLNNFIKALDIEN